MVPLHLKKRSKKMGKVVRPHRIHLCIARRSANSTMWEEGRRDEMCDSMGGVAIPNTPDVEN
jgi:hypothetical protein